MNPLEFTIIIAVFLAMPIILLIAGYLLKNRVMRRIGGSILYFDVLFVALFLIIWSRAIRDTGAMVAFITFSGLFLSSQFLLWAPIKPEKKGVAAIVLTAATFLNIFAFAAYISNNNSEARGNKPDQSESGYAIKDAMSQINQEIIKDKNWKLFVGDSEFQLGEQIFYNVTDSMGTRTSNYTEYGTYPLIDGSTVGLPMAMEFARQHLKLSEDDIPSFVYFQTAHEAYLSLIPNIDFSTAAFMKNLDIGYENSLYRRGPIRGIRSRNTIMDENHPTDILIATEPSDEELAYAEQQGVVLIVEPICYDAFVFITHKDNPVDSLTVEQVQDIYAGEITNWKEVGGDDRRIIAYQRESNSGSQTAMENLVMKNIPLMPPITIKMSMGPLVDAVAEYKNDSASIGYTYLYYIDTLYKNTDIKILSINRVFPSREKILSNDYPFSTHYYGVIRSADKDKVGGKFLKWMLSDEGQRCIEQARYIPLN